MCGECKMKTRAASLAFLLLRIYHWDRNYLTLAAPLYGQCIASHYPLGGTSDGGQDFCRAACSAEVGSALSCISYFFCAWIAHYARVWQSSRDKSIQYDDMTRWQNTTSIPRKNASARHAAAKYPNTVPETCRRSGLACCTTTLLLCWFNPRLPIRWCSRRSRSVQGNRSRMWGRNRKMTNTLYDKRYCTSTSMSTTTV